MVVAKEKEKDKQDISQNNETEISRRAFGGRGTRSQKEGQPYLRVRAFSKTFAGENTFHMIMMLLGKGSRSI